MAELAGGNLAVEFASSRQRNAADRCIVAHVARLDEPRGTTVVTADRGLIEQLAGAVSVLGPRSFLDRVGGGLSG